MFILQIIYITHLKYSFVPDEVLQNATITSENPFEDGVYFQGYKYTGVFEISMNNTDNDQPENNNNDNNNSISDDVEVF